ncbi:hypothetical protein GCM10027073_71920 [Streptomyces chlorus]
MDARAHAARAMWNLLHDWWAMLPKERRTPTAADAAIRQARKEIDWLGALPAQATQAVLKTCFRVWKNCWEGRAAAPNSKARIRTVMSVDPPQGHDLRVTRVHRRCASAPPSTTPPEPHLHFQFMDGPDPNRPASPPHRLPPCHRQGNAPAPTTPSGPGPPCWPSSRTSARPSKPSPPSSSRCPPASASGPYGT